MALNFISNSELSVFTLINLSESYFMHKTYEGIFLFESNICIENSCLSGLNQYWRNLFKFHLNVEQC